MFRNYYYLTKPGIIYGNLLTTTAGFLFAADGHFRISLYLATACGVALIIASACVFNNYIDRDIDSRMQRTSKRALAVGSIKAVHALIFATILGLIGVFVLYYFVNLLTLYLGLIAFITYVVLYGISKRKSVHGVLVGSIAGAAPIVAGYTAVDNRLNLIAFLLFIILTVWQMPHFYAIAIYRLDDYRRAKIPVLPAVYGIFQTKIQIVIYIIIFLIANIILARLTMKNTWLYIGVMLLCTLWWLKMAVKGFYSNNLSDKDWAHRMIKASLVIILINSFALSFIIG